MPLALLLALSITPGSAAASDTVRYEVSFPDPAHHEARIVADFPAARRDTLEVWISRSSPGRYAIHEFAKNVYDVQVTDAAGKPLPWCATIPTGGWCCHGGGRCGSPTRSTATGRTAPTPR